MTRAHIDFETFSELPLKGQKSVGSYKYARHPSTELLCMAWAIEDEEPELWLPGDPLPARLGRHVQEGGLVWAWNCEFEMPIWEFVCTQRMGWDPIPFNSWRDSAALALSFSLPAALGNAGKAFGVDSVKDQRGEHLINKLCKPRKPSASNPDLRWTPDTAPDDFEDLYEYCLQDVRSERAVQRKLPREDLPPNELKTWRMTVRMNQRGWQVDVDSSRRMIKFMNDRKAAALSELRALTGRRVETVGQTEKIRNFLADRGLELPNLQAETVEEALRLKLDRRSRRVLELRQELGGSATNKYASQLRLADDDGIVRNLLMYHGATTGRDAGRGIQIQNYKRESLGSTDREFDLALRALDLPKPVETIQLMYGKSPVEFASLMTRPMLRSRPGRVLFSGDFSGIENRVSAWYAGCEYALDIFRQGLDEYKMFGKKYYSCDYDDVTKKQRDHSKRAVLSLVFGSGWPRFQDTCAQYGDPCTDEVAKETVRFYRRSLYPEVVSMWSGLVDAAKAAIRNPGRRVALKRKYATVKFVVLKDFLFMTLASGRSLAYYQPKIQLKMPPWGKTADDKIETITHMAQKNSGWYRVNLIPGRIFENLVQATARDVMMEGAHQVIDAGYPLVGRVHDELINERLEGEGDLDEYLELMCPDLDWLQGVPIVAEGWTGFRYRKT
jgi:DNA polymerase